MQTELIYFDASFREGQAGLGIYNASIGEKITSNFNGSYISNSLIAETMSLIEAIRYISKRGNQRHYILMTDNLSVYQNGISPEIRGKYLQGFNIVHIYWIPRELNHIADKLARLPSIDKKPMLNKKEEIRTLPTNEKFNFIRGFCISDFEKDFVEVLYSNQVPKHPESSRERRFVNFVFASFRVNECRALEAYRKLQKGRPGMTAEKFKNFIKKRKKNESEID